MKVGKCIFEIATPSGQSQKSFFIETSKVMPTSEHIVHQAL